MTKVDNDVVHHMIPCPNCHGQGIVFLCGSYRPCFVCDEDGILEW